MKEEQVVVVDAAVTPSMAAVAERETCSDVGVASAVASSGEGGGGASEGSGSSPATAASSVDSRLIAVVSWSITKPRRCPRLVRRWW